MYILYGYQKGKWKEYARFQSIGDYAAQVKEGVERKKSSDVEERRKAALVMERFVPGNYYYGRESGKPVLRALRHFDEVGLSNDIHAALEELLDGGGEKFALLNEGGNLSDLVEDSF